MKRINMNAVISAIVFTWYATFALTYGMLMTGCSNGGEFARTDKKAGAEAPKGTLEVPDVVVLDLPEAEEGCTLCCYTIEEIHAALSACKGARKKDHVICVYDHLFSNHNHVEGE